MSDRQPKFKIGDKVIDRMGEIGVVQDVRKDSFSGFYTTYDYDVYLPTLGTTNIIAEMALELYNEPTSRACDCGAHAVAWMTGQHARWCSTGGSK
jgi:hypothetical protein